MTGWVASSSKGGVGADAEGTTLCADDATEDVTAEDVASSTEGVSSTRVRW